MIDDGKYCVSILNQIKAAKSALVTVEAQILKKHTIMYKEFLTDKKALDKKVDELLRLINNKAAGE